MKIPALLVLILMVGVVCADSSLDKLFDAMILTQNARTGHIDLLKYSNYSDANCYYSLTQWKNVCDCPKDYVMRTNTNDYILLPYVYCEKVNFTEIDEPTVYWPNITLQASDFLGYCNQTALNTGSLMAYGECTGNFLSPAFPNPLAVLSAGNLRDNIDLLKFSLSPFNDEGYLSLDSFLKNFLDSVWSLIKLPLVLLSIIVQVLFNAVKFILVSLYRFIFVYVLYVSLGFQAILLLFRQDYKLEHPDKLNMTFGIMIAATIFILSYGGGWVSW